MKCFQFSYLEKNDEERQSQTISISDQSFNSTYTEYDSSKGSNRMANIPSFSQRSKKLREFKYGELKLATKGFSVSSKIGEGGFGSVYKGVIKCPHDPARSIDVAVKQLGKRGLQGHKEWVTEVNVLGVVDHPNLVKLVGYCEEDDEKGIQRLLVYEYMRNRSVENHLSNRSEVPLSWTMRLKVARDAARGLAYLHEEMNFQIIFRDFKSSNILLDDEWNAKLSDFGLARVGPLEGLNHVSTAVVGTVGYSAPEYIQTAHLTSKSDVWSYGVFLYELITGRRPLDRNRPKTEQMLLEWIKPYLDAKNFRLIVDPRLQGKYSLKIALKLSYIANKCLSRSPKTRPKMSEVLLMVSQLIEAPLEPVRGAPSGPPLRIMLPVVPSVEAIEPDRFFMWFIKCKKTSRDMKNEGKQRSMEVKLGDSDWLSRIWTSKLLRTC